MVHVRQLHHPRARRDRAGIGGDDRFVVIEETELAGDGLDALALLTLQPAGAHAGIVPGRDQHLIARQKRYAENCRRQAFRRIAVQRDLRRRAVDQPGELGLDAGQRGIEPAPHVDLGIAADEPIGIDHPLLDLEGRRADRGVVKVQERLLPRIGGPHLQPECLGGDRSRDSFVNEAHIPALENLPAGFQPAGRDTAQRPPMWKALSSRYSSIPARAPSRPRPDCLTPPKGETAVEIAPAFSPTMPNSSASPTRQARRRLSV